MRGLTRAERYWMEPVGGCGELFENHELPPVVAVLTERGLGRWIPDHCDEGVSCWVLTEAGELALRVCPVEESCGV